MARSKKKTNKVKINFEGVEGKRSVLPDDDYLVEVEAAELKEGSEHPYFELTMVVQSGPHKGSKIWDRASTAPNALWRLRSLLEVMGLDVPDGPMEIEPDDLVGTTFVAVTAQESYKGSNDEKKVAVRMVDFYAPDESDAEEDEDDEEEEPKKKGKSKKDEPKAKAKKGKSKKDEEDEDDEEESDEDDEEDEEEETPEERKKRLRKERRLKRKAQDEDEEEDEPKPKKGKGKKASKNEDDEEEEEEPKSKKKGKGKKKSSKVSSDDVMEADEEVLQELIDEHELDVDLDDYKTLRKKQAAVIDALEENDLLEE